MIRKGDVHGLKEIMSKSTEQGMQTFDQALFELFRAGDISYESAIASADSANDLRLLIKLSGGDLPQAQTSAALAGLSLEESNE